MSRIDPSPGFRREARARIEAQAANTGVKGDPATMPLAN